MYIAMNRFKVQKGSEEAFENVWKNRDSSLAEMKGFEQFHLLRGPLNEAEGYTLFASHTVWASQEDFVAWTKSENFRAAHKNAGSNKAVYIGHPQLGFFRRRRRVKCRSRTPIRPERSPSCPHRTSRSRATFTATASGSRS